MSVAIQSSVLGPGWVDNETVVVSGRNPLAVEQQVAAGVRINAPGISTQTRVARYYVLHPLIAAEAAKRDLDNESFRQLLRRVEVAFAAVAVAHERHPQHRAWFPRPPGVRVISPQLTDGLEMRITAGDGPGEYTKARWGYSGQYAGPELALHLRAGELFAPGDAFDEPVVRTALGQVFELASLPKIDQEVAQQYPDLCICQTVTSADGDLLARLFSGKPDEPGTQMGNLGATMQMLAAAVSSGDMRENTVGLDLGTWIMYGSGIDAKSSEIWLRWRGLRLRAESVQAWRGLFAWLGQYLKDHGGAMDAYSLGKALAAQMPNGTVGAFLSELPDIRHSNAAQEFQVRQSYPEPIADIAVLALGAKRAALASRDPDAQVLGFLGPRQRVELLSPKWMEDMLKDWQNRPMSEFGMWLCSTLLNRAHRVSMSKTRSRSGKFVVPARILVRDDDVARVNDEVTGLPTLRLSQLLEIGRQIGLFQVDSGVWELGNRGHYLK